MTPDLPTSGTSGLSSTFDWTPAVGQAGVYSIKYQVTDGTDTTFCTADITVNEIPDTENPFCEVTNIDPGPPFTITVTIEDLDSGIESINIVQDDNATVTIPSFTAGTNETIIVTAVKIDESQAATVVLEVTDVAGNSVLCDPVYSVLSSAVPQDFDLKQNYPNPFNPGNHYRVCRCLRSGTG